MGQILMQLRSVMRREASSSRDPYDWSPLHILANNKDEWGQRPGMIQQLLDKGASIEAKKGKAEQTPRMTAAGSGHLAAVETLLLNGASVEAKNNEGTSVLDMAWHNKELGALIKNVNVKRGRGTTGSGRL